MNTVSNIEVRPMRTEDRDAVIVLLSATQSWVPGELFDRFFSWKHRESPFGASPAWVATVAERVVGFRTFVRWEFEHPDGRIRRAVRAVDTATHPDYQGRGIFSRLTLASIEELRADGVDFVFNTPNDKSRPGLPEDGLARGRATADRGSSQGSSGARADAALASARRALVAGEQAGGLGAAEVLADPGIAELLATMAPPRALRTRRTVDYLRWRYSFEPLGLPRDRARRPTPNAASQCSGSAARRRDRSHALRSARTARRQPRRARTRARGRPGEQCGLRHSTRSVVDSLQVLPHPRARDRCSRGETCPAGQSRPGLADWQLQLGDVELF